MTYPAFDTAVPNATQAREDAIDSISANLMAVRDALVATGVVQGFNSSLDGGTTAQPARYLFKRGTEWIKVEATWGTTGGEDGNLIKAAFYYSSDSGGSYDPMADAAGKYVLTIAYNSDSDFVSGTWGSTP